MKRCSFTYLAITMFAYAGCGEASSQRIDSTTADAAATPEGAYRELLVAMLAADEKVIRDLIIDRGDAGVLWEGPYPKDVAALLAEQYRTMEIFREEGDGTEQVVLQSSAIPFPLAVRKIAGSWKVDAGPIIEARRATKALAPAID